MATYYFRMKYLLDGQTEPVEVTADQRDVAAYEAEPFGAPSGGDMGNLPITFWRYLAWSAARRTGARDIATWPAWQKACVWADYLPDDVPADAEDPGLPGRSDTP